MTASKKITEAEAILHKMYNLSEQETKIELHSFVKTIHDAFLHLLDEYNVKFGLKIERIGLEKFKSVARKSGKIEAINFLIWYEKEYKKLRNNPEFGKLLEREHVTIENQFDILSSCAMLVDEVKKMAYHAYENF
jgi:hypothetical protein